ncbi:hypothetical protein [Kochikohdavirus PBEF19]|uniref:SprT-like domain-containing protein n=1 Tax=Enterococcus phage PBEF129 TaxID=2696337 RepID=A0A7T3JE74_9CAUD|nr:hypothetical protein [Enterococcus phage PBEF129]
MFSVVKADSYVKSDIEMYEFKNVKSLALTKKEKELWSDKIAKYVNEFIVNAYGDYHGNKIPEINVVINGKLRRTLGSFVQFTNTNKHCIEINGRFVKEVILLQETPLAQRALDILMDVARHEAIHYTLCYLNSLSGGDLPTFNYHDGGEDFEKDLCLTGTSPSGATKEEYIYSSFTLGAIRCRHHSTCPECGLETYMYTRGRYYCHNGCVGDNGRKIIFRPQGDIAIYIDEPKSKAKPKVEEALKDYKGALKLPYTGTEEIK